MIELKTPAIFLSFDDKFIKEWFALLGPLKEFDMKVTFYVSVLYSKTGYGIERKPITDDEWGMLKEMRANGHAIGYHGYHHLNMREAIKESSQQDYIDKEINMGIEVFKGRDFNLRHFCYPYGVHNEKMDRCLLKDFDTLRTTISLKFKEDDILCDKRRLDGRRVFRSLSLEDGTTEENEKILSVLEYLVESDSKILFARMHEPDNKIMNRLFSYQESGVNFYSMEVFER